MWNDKRPCVLRLWKLREIVHVGDIVASPAHTVCKWYSTVLYIFLTVKYMCTLQTRVYNFCMRPTNGNFHSKQSNQAGTHWNGQIHLILPKSFAGDFTFECFSLQFKNCFHRCFQRKCSSNVKSHLETVCRWRGAALQWRRLSITFVVPRVAFTKCQYYHRGVLPHTTIYHQWTIIIGAASHY